MDFTSVNGDISFEYDVPKCDNILFKWNINNNFICKKYTDTIYFLNNLYFKLLLDTAKNTLKLINTNKLFDIKYIESKLDKDNLNVNLDKIITYIDNLDTNKINQDDNELYNLFFDYYSDRLSLDFIIKNNSFITNLINDINKLNELKHVFICNDDSYDIFYIELYYTKNNQKLNKLIDSKIINSINITLILLPSMLPKIKFIIDFENIDYNDNIQNVFCDELSLYDTVIKLIEYVENDNIFNTFNNKSLNINNNHIIKQIIKLNLDTNNKDLESISLYLNNLAILKL